MSKNAYYQRGFGLKEAIGPELRADYHSGIVERIKAAGHRLEAGDLTFLLAREFGFCYGVDRAVEYAYETRRQFPDRTIYLTGEIIHNPHVNARLKEMGIRFLRDPDGGGPGLQAAGPGDVVILPAFGVTVQEMDELRAKGREALIAHGRERSPSWDESEFGPWADAKLQVSPSFSARPFFQNEPPWQELVPKITCPVLLITSDPEKGGLVTPGAAEEARRLNPRVKVVRVSGAGHNIRREQFEAFVEAVRGFLADI